MKKLQIGNLIIEVTRRCNLACEHCLRGDPEPLDLDYGTLQKFLDSVSSIGSIAFTGGEPSLNVPAIEFILDCCKQRAIEVGSFYVVSNGVEHQLELLAVLAQWYTYCSEKDGCGVSVSTGDYHGYAGGCYQGEDASSVLSALACYQSKADPEGVVGGIAEGHGVNFFERVYTGDELVAQNTGDTLLVDGGVYYTADGNILAGCDWSYESMRKQVICKAADFPAYCEELSSGTSKKEN